ncbi:MAG TPA: hypothetical protein VD884_15310 [Ohtaekwangia sp.]|nr:hypothetical protein [Ohtaekwangia sp.]
MSYFSKKTILTYLYDQLTGNFAGFVIGISATGLVSNFFETRSIKNLWGLGAKKTIVDKETFQNLEWIISIVIGFIVFEVMTRIVKEKIDKYFPLFRIRLYRWIIQNKLQEKTKNLSGALANQGRVFFSGFNNSLRRTLSKFSKS